MKEILLHSCCGPCASASAERLIEEDRKPVLFYSNSNICTEEEFLKRLDSLERVANHFNLDIITDPYDNKSWLKAVKGFEEEPEGGARCSRCFLFSLSRSGEKASELKMPFTTTLTISPHKRSETIFNSGKGIDRFEEHNFKKRGGFQRSIVLSRELSLYRQTFCGCCFSKRADASIS